MLKSAWVLHSVDISADYFATTEYSGDCHLVRSRRSELNTAVGQGWSVGVREVHGLLFTIEINGLSGATHNYLQT